MEMTKQKFTRIKNKILKKYPNAITKIDKNGLFYVSDGVTRLCEEYMIPSQKTIGEAWWWVLEIIKTDKNIERTHPDRMDMCSFESKFNRISNRNKRKK
jgi:hypothetical protein